jgi:hypothetical protein
VASNEITIKVNVQKDGNLKLTAKEADQAAKSTDKLGKSTDRTTKARNRYNKAEKGVGQAGLSSGKAFSKMNQTMGGGGGLVAAYAVLAANIFALTAAFGALSRAAQVDKLKEGMVAMGQSTGIAMNALSENLVKATGYAISLEEAMRTTAQVTSAGFDPSVIERLGSVARMASQALGRDLGDAMQRITKGAIKMEPELLDELGIMVRLDDATSAYAASIGKSADDLTKFEKQQAFMNAVLEEGEAKFSALGDVDVNPYTKLAATFTNLTEALLSFFNKALSPIVDVLGSSTVILGGALLIFASTVGKIVQPALAAFTTKMGDAAKKQSELAIAQVQLTGATGKGAKGVMALKNELAKGNVQTTKWKSGLASSVKSVKGYELALAKNVKTTGLFSKATIASERALKQAKIDHYALIKAKRDLDIANIKNSSTNAMNTLQTNGLRAGIKVLRVEMAGLYGTTVAASAGMGFLARGMAVASGAAKAAATGFAFLGAAIMAAMNVIGLVIMALYMLWEAAKWLWNLSKTAEQNALEKAMEDAATAMEDTKKNLKELDAAYDGQKTKIVGIVGQYEALSNILRTAGDEYRKIAAAQKAADEAGLFKKGGDAVQGASQLVLHVQELAKGSNTMKKTLEDAGISMSDLASGNVTLDQLNAAMAQVEETNKKVNLRFVGMAAAIKGMNEPLTEFLNKMKSTSDVDELVTSMQDMAQVFIAKDNPFGAFENLAAFAEEASDAQLKLLGTTKKLITDTNGNEAAEMRLFNTLKKSFKLQKELFENEQKQQILHKQNLKNIKLEISLLKSKQGVTGSAGALFDKEVESRTAIAQRMQENIDLQRSLNKDAKVGSNVALEILGLEKELSVFKKLTPGREARNLVVAKEALAVAQASQIAKKEELAVLEKMQDVNSKLFDLSTKQARRVKEAQNRANPARNYDATLNAKDELDLNAAPMALSGLDADLKKVDLGVRSANDARLEAARADMNITLTKVELERRIAGLRLEVVEAEMRLLHKKQEDAKEVIHDRNSSDGSPYERTAFEETAGSDTINRVKALTAEGGPMDNAGKALAHAIFDGAEAEITANTAGLKDEQRSGILNAGGDTSADVLSNQGEQGGIGSLKNKSDQFKAFGNAMKPMMDQLRSLGPQGELVAAVAQGALVMGESFTKMGETLKSLSEDNSFEGKMKKTAAVAQAVSATIGQMASIMAASSQNKIAGIDQEINAEKKRDGKSKESLAKIKALESKKEAAKRKAFETNKKMMMAQAIANTAAGITMALATMVPPYSFIMAGITAAMGMAQLAVISGTSYQGGGSSAGIGAPSSVSVGQRGTSSDMSKSKSARGELAYFRGAQGTGGAENFRSAFYGKKHRASGGNTGYVVGEQGPELFMPDRPGTIVPADEVGGGGGSTNVNFSINAIDAAGVEDVLLEQQGNIIGMLRQASNSYGQDFMEDIDDTIYTAPAARRA